MNVGDLVYVIERKGSCVTPAVIVALENEFGVIRVQAVKHGYEFGTARIFICQTLDEVKLILSSRGYTFAEDEVKLILSSHGYTLTDSF